MRDGPHFSCGTMRDRINLHFERVKRQYSPTRRQNLRNSGDSESSSNAFFGYPFASFWRRGASPTTQKNFGDGFFTHKTHGAPVLVIQPLMVIHVRCRSPLLLGSKTVISTSMSKIAALMEFLLNNFGNGLE